MTTRRRKKIIRKRFLITLVVLVCAGAIYYFWPNFIQFFKRHQQEPQSLESYKSKLNKYSVFGIDVSTYQQTIDWETVLEKQEIDFVIMRATAGSNNADKQFKRNWKALDDTDIIRGAYHYYRPNENSEKQAKFFIKHTKLEKGDLPPILDIEKYSRVQSVNNLKTGLLNWLKIVENHYGVTPILYSYNNFYVTTLANDERFDKYPVWIAWYNLTKDPSTVKKDWIFWQFTDKGIIEGIEGPVDVNVFNGKKVELNGLRIR